MIPSSKPRRNSSVRELIDKLGKLSHHFSPSDAAEKEEVLRAIQQQTIQNASLLFRYHEIQVAVEHVT